MENLKNYAVNIVDYMCKTAFCHLIAVPYEQCQAMKIKLLFNKIFHIELIKNKQVKKEFQTNINTPKCAIEFHFSYMYP